MSVHTSYPAPSLPDGAPAVDGPVIHTVVVLAKEPRPGFAKTRLTPPLTPAQASRLAAAALDDTLDAVAGIPAHRRVLAFDGDASAWLPIGWDLAAQPTGGLDRRLAAAFAAVERGPAVLVGMDTPQLLAADLTAWDPARYDACLGPATDGGYWALGLADPRHASAALLGIPMSRDDTGAHQLARLRSLGLRVQLLDELTDVDTIAAAYEVARLVPQGAFGTALRQAA